VAAATVVSGGVEALADSVEAEEDRKSYTEGFPSPIPPPHPGMDVSAAAMDRPCRLATG
jgi:hypothetical protein